MHSPNLKLQNLFIFPDVDLQTETHNFLIHYLNIACILLPIKIQTYPFKKLTHKFQNVGRERIHFQRKIHQCHTTVRNRKKVTKIAEDLCPPQFLSGLKDVC